jgi:group I intron endonuclease
MIIFFSVKFESKSFKLKIFFTRNFTNYYDSIIFKHAIKIYIDPLNERNIIRKDNNEKIGVYSWFNKVNGKFYIGSGDPLYLRISDYFQNWYILSRPNLQIVRAISKYSIKNFSLIILEYSDSNNLILCEQKWIDLLKPEYNLSLIARNTKGYKHHIKNKNIIQETKEVLNHYNRWNNNFINNKIQNKKSVSLLKVASAKINKSFVSGIKVEITNIETKITTIYESIRKAAEAINSDIKTILRREKSQRNKGINTPYRNKYTIIIKR